MPDNLEALAASSPPIAPQAPPTKIPSVFEGLRVRLAPVAAIANQIAGGGLIPLSKELMAIGSEAQSIITDPHKRLEFLTGMVSTGGEGENLFEGLRVRKVNKGEIVVQPEVTSRATPTGESAKLPPEIHESLEEQVGRALSDDEAVALDRANLERGMVSAPAGDTAAIRDAKRSELEKPRSESEQPKDIIEGAGLIHRGEIVRGSDVHMFEHPDHPGKTASLKAPFTSEQVKTHMDTKIADFAASKKLGK